MTRALLLLPLLLAGCVGQLAYATREVDVSETIKIHVVDPNAKMPETWSDASQLPKMRIWECRTDHEFLSVSYDEAVGVDTPPPPRNYPGAFDRAPCKLIYEGPIWIFG